MQVMYMYTSVYILKDVQLVQVLCGHHRRDELLSDYCDGTIYQSHDLFSTVPSSLEILAYYDDVEVCTL